MAWVSFTTEDGEKQAFNTAYIATVKPCRRGRGSNRGTETLIEVASGKDFHVKETAEVVLQAISAAGNGGKR